MRLLTILLLVFLTNLGSVMGIEKLRLLIVDGQNNHQWEVTTPILKKIYADSGRFEVDVATSPPAGHDMSSFQPKFSDYDVVVSNYNGEPWSEATEQAFQAYVYGGGGFVSVHAADNAFPDWPEYNEIVGLGGWGGRNEKSGPYVYLMAGELKRDVSAGRGGNHGKQHEFQVKTLQKEHPIMKGIPTVWLHTQDELYEQLRGPANNLEVLATAYADPKYGGTGRDEPMLMTITYGDGRVFHTVLGHADYSMNCVGFQATLLRGTEWAATGEVTLAVPEKFPTAEKTEAVE
ncbi:ThuA domain-containing protein [Bythopirellula polymerisocia]|uniref:Trehalose utilization n=1 Tax=Bythopirellula polymerisocia TaxID=2528003 RepID=A0A5C6CXN9_9BACT|nr:ThuA domain-containing protein [Bythopirellula polymerisocia]TWU29372.1 Trehalose utilization [Bythopirellula polymerisocia]